MYLCNLYQRLKVLFIFQQIMYKVINYHCGLGCYIFGPGHRGSGFDPTYSQLHIGFDGHLKWRASVIRVISSGRGLKTPGALINGDTLDFVFLKGNINHK